MSIIHPEPRCDQRHGKGFALPSAIFLLVILSALAAFMVSLSTSQHIGSMQDVQGSRAYWAARAALDFELYTLLDPENGTPGAAAFVACPALPVTVTLPPDYADFTVQITDCVATPMFTDNGVNVVVYRVTAQAFQGGAPGGIGYIERQVTVSAAKCKDPNAMLADGVTADPRNRCQ